MTALNAQWAAIVVKSEPVVTRRPAMMTPPTKRTTNAPAMAGTIRTTGIVVFMTVKKATVPCQSANAMADASTAVRTPYRASSPPSNVPR